MFHRVATLLAVLRDKPAATTHHANTRWGFRNEYLVSRYGTILQERLIANGFARADQPLLRLQNFHPTDVGRMVVRLIAKCSGRVPRPKTLAIFYVDTLQDLLSLAHS
ncbi:hypothetical protein [Duganella levis]|uniref:Uncharacterized protein n=1 Tax=Duganella levis TaxID=2692169 RepID=A0ABW9W5K9_9BURK|nr:hypothetical protein [Duganella levis]MYN29209.1 hypothetical protein [Duganella levis]